MVDFERVVDGIAVVDDMNRIVADAVASALEVRADRPLTRADIRSLMRQVDTSLSSVYGSSQQTARSSAMFRAIVKEMDLTTEEVYRAFFHNLARELSAVDPSIWPQVTSEFERLGETDRLARTYLSVYGSPDQRQRYLRASLLDPNRRWVDADNYRLSDRIWKTRSTIRAKINATLREGIRKGESVDVIARRLNEYLNPDLASVRFTRGGRVLRQSPNRVSASTFTRRLVRTELSHVASLATIESVEALAIDGAGVKFNLSPAHPRADICDSKAAGSSRGYPRGVYAPSDFPTIPQHPQCLCNSSPWLPSREEVLRQLTERYLA